jgi:hypothetical protein
VFDSVPRSDSPQIIHRWIECANGFEFVTKRDHGYISKLRWILFGTNMCPSTEMIVEPEQESDKMMETQESPRDDDSCARKWPEERDGHGLISRLCHAYSCWTYSYMGSILLKGSQRAKNESAIEKITQHDLYPAPSTMKSSYLKSQFKEQFFAAPSDDIVVVDDDKKTLSTKWKLLRTLWRLAAPTFIPAGFCQLITVVCQIAIPLLVRELLNTLEETPGEKVIKKGMPCKYFSWYLVGS